MSTSTVERSDKIGRRIPPPRVDKVEQFLVVRDDLVPGGTKRRAIYPLIYGADEFVYASPAQGYAQLALAYACRDLGKQATIFVAKRNELHPITAEAKAAGAKIVQVPMGFLSHVTARAKAYCEPSFLSSSHKKLMPFGLGCEEFIDEMANVARSLNINPLQVWCACGSGTLTRALQRAWPDAKHYAVAVGAAGRTAKIGRAKRLIAPEKYEQAAKEPPPFPSCVNYDAKVWQFIQATAMPGALFWNVAR
jgi:hypothetical protein